MSGRPASIRWFGAIYLLWMAVITSFEGWFLFMGGARRSALDAPPSIAIISGLLIAAHLGVNLALRHFVVVRPKLVARTIFTVLLAGGWGFFLYRLGLDMWGRRLLPNWRIGLVALNLAVQLGLMWLLFRPDASAWLRGDIADAPEALEETFR